MNKRKLKKAIKRIMYLPLNVNLMFYLSNKIKYFYFKLTKSTKVAYPSTIMLELTNYCNLSCTICPREYEYGKKMDKGIMDVKNAKAIIDEVYPYLDSVGLTGMGETFMYNHLVEIVDYLKSASKCEKVFFGLNLVKTANILVFSLGCFVKQGELPGFKNKLSFNRYLPMS